MLTICLFFAVCVVAYSNGANDNFKGVASLFGSRTCGYRTAIGWATVATCAGSLAAIFLAQELIKRFSGKGLVPDSLTDSPGFVLAVALGAGVTVLLATRLGFPISTTHGLTGALVGAGFVAVGMRVNLLALANGFVLPLLLSPLLAVGFGAIVYLAARLVQRKLGIRKEVCFCAGVEQGASPTPQCDGTAVAQGSARFTVSMDNPSVCVERYNGIVFGVNAGKLVDVLHFGSAGAVSFARGLNDTPKIAALLLVGGTFGVRSGLALVAIGIAAGGLLSAKRVAETMSYKLTEMNPGQGLAANLATAVLVTTASVHGLPVSTTHVSVGSLLGMGMVTGQTKWKPVLGVLASWVVTLPCAALAAATAYALVKLL